MFQGSFVWFVQEISFSRGSFFYKDVCLRWYRKPASSKFWKLFIFLIQRKTIKESSPQNLSELMHGTPVAKVSHWKWRDAFLYRCPTNPSQFRWHQSCSHTLLAPLVVVVGSGYSSTMTQHLWWSQGPCYPRAHLAAWTASHHSAPWERKLPGPAVVRLGSSVCLGLEWCLGYLRLIVGSMGLSVVPQQENAMKPGRSSQFFRHIHGPHEESPPSANRTYVPCFFRESRYAQVVIITMQHRWLYFPHISPYFQPRYFTEYCNDYWVGYIFPIIVGEE